LTAASDRRQADLRPQPQLQPPAHRDRRRPTHRLAAAVLVGCEVAGIAAVVNGYRIGQTTQTSTADCAWFWAGMFLLELPLAALVARRATSPALRTALLILYGLVTYAPKLLRNPHGPLYHDEFAHWRATYNILSTGKLFRPSPIVPIISRYPGLHAATAAIVHATGLTIWQAATLLLIVLHVTLALGIAALAEALGLSNRAASLMAVLYGLNSSFLYFDTQYAYESMAITLVVWTLVAHVQAIRSRPGPQRAAWSALSVLLSAGTVVTHHLSTLTLVVIMALVSLAVSLRWLARGEGWVRAAVTAWSLTGVTALMAGAWLLFVAPATLSYLTPYVGTGLSQLLQLARGGGGGRQLFGASLSPGWEQKSAYLMTLLALGLAAGGLLLVRAQIKNRRLPPGRRRALLLAFAVLGLVYFPSTVFILSSSGAEGARRSWAFTWIGLCVLAGPAAVWALDRAGRRAPRWQRVGLRSGLLAALAIALVGGTAAGLDASYRFPGPFLYGSDARSVTPELLGTSRWFSVRFGTGNNIVTDRYTGLIFASFGLQNTAAPSAGFPTYDLYLAKPGAPIRPSSLLAELGSSHYTYLIVDERMAYDVPEVGVYFEPSESSSFVAANGKPLFYGRLGKFDTMSWMVKVFQSDNYSVYRLTLPATKIGYQPRPPAPRERPSPARRRRPPPARRQPSPAPQGKLLVIR
jgi:hypothetical protein